MCGWTMDWLDSTVAEPLKEEDVENATIEANTFRQLSPGASANEKLSAQSVLNKASNQQMNSEQGSGI